MSENGKSEPEEAPASVCLTDDIEGFDTATRFSAVGEADEDSKNLIIDLDELLEQYCEEQEALKVQNRGPSTSNDGACERKCQDWLRKAEFAPTTTTNREDVQVPGCSYGSTSSTKPNVNQISHTRPSKDDVPTEKAAALLIDSIRGAKTYNTYGTDNDGNENRKVALDPIPQLIADIHCKLPDALMCIIYHVSGSVDIAGNDSYYLRMRTLFLNVLKHAQALERSEEKGLNGDESILEVEPFESDEMKEQYFDKFEVVIPSARLNKFILEDVEAYVNEQIEFSKARSHPWIAISNQKIYDIIDSANKSHSLGLAAEKLAKYCTKLQKYVWGNMLNRCITYLSQAGFDFRRSLEKDGDFLSSADRMTSSQESVSTVGHETEPVERREAYMLAVVAAEESYASLEEANEFASQSTEGDPEFPELEGLRDFQSSQQSISSLSPSLEYPSSLPRRSPDAEAMPSSPRRCQLLDDFANQTCLSFLSQGSSSSNDSGPSPKLRRIY